MRRGRVKVESAAARRRRLVKSRRFASRNPRMPRPIRNWVPYVTGLCQSPKCPGGGFRLLYANRRLHFVPTGKVFEWWQRGLCPSCGRRQDRQAVKNGYRARVLQTIDEALLPRRGKVRSLSARLFDEAVGWFKSEFNRNGGLIKGDLDWIATLDRYAPPGRNATRELGVMRGNVGELATRRRDNKVTPLRLLAAQA